MEQQNPPPSERRISLLIMGAAAFMVASDARVIDPLLNTIAGQFNVLSASMAISAYTFPYGLCQLIYGPLGDRLGKVRVMSIAFSLFAVGTAACAFVPSGPSGMTMLIALRFVTGVFAAAIIPLSIAYIGDKYPTEQRQATLGQFMGALMLGIVFSGPLGGIFGDYFGWRNIFLVLGGISALVAMPYLRAAAAEPLPLKDPSRKAAPVLEGYKQVFGNSNWMIVYPAIFLEGLFLFGGFVYISGALQINFGMSIFYSGLLVAFYGVGGLIYSFAAKRVLKQLSQWQMALMGGMLLFGGFGIASALPSFGAWWPIMPALLCVGFGFNSIHSTIQTKATELAPKARGTAVSVFAFFFFLGQSLGVQGSESLGIAMGHKGANGNIIKAYWLLFLVSGAGLFLMSLWLAWRLPKMAKEKN